MTQMKTCSGCDKRLSVTHFNRDRSHHDGYASRCRECRSKDRRRRRVLNNLPAKAANGVSVDDRKRQATTKAITELIQRHRAEFSALLKAEQRRHGVSVASSWKSLNSIDG